MKETKVIKQHTFGHLYSTHATFSSLKKFSCARHSSSKLDSALTCRNFLLAFPDTFRCVSCQFSEITWAVEAVHFLSFCILFPRETRERPLLLFLIFIDIVFCMCERPILPQISQILADKPQNNIKQTVFLCEIMQLCCIPLRDLRYLRENIHIRVLNLSAQRNPNVSRRFRWFTQTKDRLIKWLC